MYELLQYSTLLTDGDGLRVEFRRDLNDAIQSTAKPLHPIDDNATFRPDLGKELTGVTSEVQQLTTDDGDLLVASTSSFRTRLGARPRTVAGNYPLCERHDRADGSSSYHRETDTDEVYRPATLPAACSDVFNLNMLHRRNFTMVGTCSMWSNSLLVDNVRHVDGSYLPMYIDTPSPTGRTWTNNNKREQLLARPLVTLADCNPVSRLPALSTSADCR